MVARLRGSRRPAASSSRRAPSPRAGRWRRCAAARTWPCSSTRSSMTASPVPFFGRPAMTAPALALLALHFDCAVLPARVERLEGARFRLTLEPPLPLPRSGDRGADVAALMAARQPDARTLDPRAPRAMVLAAQPLAGLAPEQQSEGDRGEGGGGEPQRHAPATARGARGAPPGRRGSRRAGRRPRATSRRPAGRGCATGAGSRRAASSSVSIRCRSRASGPRLSRIHSSTSGRASAQILTLGSSRRPTPSTSTIVFCSSSSCGWVSISNCSVTWKSCASSRAIEISCSGRPRIGSPIERQAWVKASSERARGHIAGVEMHLGDAAVIAGQEADQHVGEDSSASCGRAGP